MFQCRFLSTDVRLAQLKPISSDHCRYHQLKDQTFHILANKGGTSCAFTDQGCKNPLKYQLNDSITSGQNKKINPKLNDC